METSESWNMFANQFTLISGLLSGFSISLVIALLPNKLENRFVKYIFMASIFASASFIVALFAMTGVLMLTGPEFYDDGHMRKFLRIAIPSLFTGIISLFIIIGLSGWTKSKTIGIFSTIVSIVALFLVFLTAT